MKHHTRLLLLGLLSASLLAGCGGDDPPIVDRGEDSSSGGGGDGGGTGGDGGGSGDGTASGLSYVPLSVFESYRDFSGFDSDNMFQGDEEVPLIDRNLINPIDAATMASVDTAVAGDYKVTIDGVDIDETESFPILQRVIGSQTALRTALVFDLSNSVSEVDMDALVAEAKAYIAASQASSNTTISSQQFVVWAFAEQVQEITTGFTDNAGTLNAALDSVATLFDSQALGNSSNLHRAVVEAIGRFDGTENGNAYNFRDGLLDPDDGNDLIDWAVADGVRLNQLVIFSSGPDTALEFSQATMGKAIESQSFLKYDTTAGSSSDTMRKLKKPVFYYVVGLNSPGTVYAGLSGQAERTTSIVLSGGAYSFANTLIANQLTAIDARIDLDNQYLYRYAFLPRAGDHTSVFSSTNATGFSYALTTSYDHDYISVFGGIVPTVEITGPNGEYISNQTLQVASATTFRPATRWTPATYVPANYSWAVTAGAVTGTANPDGSYTVTAVTGSPATLQLTNTAIGESYQIVLTN